MTARAAPRERLTVRQEERRRLILAAARQLLRDHGWHAVAIDEIGLASGLTGPAVYRYFDSKQALLTEAMTHAAGELWSSVPPGPRPDLAGLVDSHVGFVLANTDLIQLWYSEARHLPADVRHAQRRLQRRYIQCWVDALLLHRPALDPTLAPAMVRAAIGLTHSVAHADDGRHPAHQHDLLVSMALRALDT
jgi:AcrR family transcriptional regulator